MTDSHEQSAQDSFLYSSSSEQYDNQYYDDCNDLSDDLLYSKPADTVDGTQSFEVRDTMLLEDGFGEYGREESMSLEVQVDKRPDILKAREAPRRIRSRLYFKGEDELSEKKESVKLDEVLEEDFHVQQEKLKQVEAETLEEVDAVPKHVMESMNKIKVVSEANATSTFRASTILETAMPAFEYGRKAAQDTFNLRRGSKTALDTFNRAFKDMLKLRSDGSVEDAARKLNSECYPSLEEAVQEAKDDRSSHEERFVEENSILTMEGVASLRRDTEVAIKEGIEDYSLIVKKCDDDLCAIDEHSAKLKADMEEAKRTYVKEKLEREAKLVANRKRQQELRKELEDLETEDRKLVENSEEAKKLQEIADKDYQSAEGAILQWREEIATLGKQATASLAIMDRVAESTEQILTDAEKHKTRWSKDLKLMKVDSLLHLRDALIAKGCVHQMESDDSKNNIGIIQDEIESIKKKQRRMAEQGFTEMVQKHREETKSLEGIKENYEESKKKHDSEVTAIKEELKKVDKDVEDLKKVDKDIGELKPGIRLDSFEERYQSFQRTRRRFFSGDLEDVQFCSHGNYSHY